MNALPFTQTLQVVKFLSKYHRDSQQPILHQQLLGKSNFQAGFPSVEILKYLPPDPSSYFGVQIFFLQTRVHSPLCVNFLLYLTEAMT
ncbi:unnamed protein product [Bathycoccus prasinos]